MSLKRTTFDESVMKKCTLLFFISSLSFLAHSAESYEQCLTHAIHNANDTLTIGELKKSCRADLLVKTDQRNALNLQYKDANH